MKKGNKQNEFLNGESGYKQADQYVKTLTNKKRRFIDKKVILQEITAQ